MDTWPLPGQSSLSLPSTTSDEEDAIREATSIRRRPDPTLAEIQIAKQFTPRLVRKPDGHVVRVRGPLKPGFKEVLPRDVGRADYTVQISIDTELRGERPAPWPDNHRPLSRGDGTTEEKLTVATDVSQSDDTRRTLDVRRPR